MPNPKNADRIYKVLFLNQGKIYELYARQVYQGNLYGFIEIEELIFGEKSSLLVDPAEEKLQGEFAGVKRSFVPIHSIVRIDEVEREGVSKIHPAEGGSGNVAPFPVYPPTGRGKTD